MRTVMVQQNAPGGVSIVEVPVPSAAPGEALLRVSAASVNPTDLDLIAHAPDGLVGGHEVAGVIEVPAADGSGPAAGARVTGMIMGGGWAEYVAVPTAQLVSVPDSVDLEEAAVLPMAGLSALRALRALGSTLGRRVLITGASGSVGMLAVQLAAISGSAERAAVARDVHAHAMLQELGATSISTSVTPDLGQFDGIIDNVGGPTLKAAFALLASNATLVSVGRASGEDVVLSPADLRADQAGSGRALRTFFMPEEGAELGPDLEYLINLVAMGRLHVNSGRSVSFERGLEMFRAPNGGGKLILVTRS